MSTVDAPPVDLRSALDSTADAQRWLSREARLLDDRRFQDWLDLFRVDAVYRIPIAPDSDAPAQDVSLIYDDHARLSERVFRAESSVAHCEDPPTRTCRLVSNVELEVTGPDHRRVRSNVAIATVRRGIDRVYYATVHHDLVRTDGSWKVAARSVVLLAGEERLRHLTFIV